MDRPEPVTRCSRCVLPSSLPGSDFDEAGECLWCQLDFPHYAPRGEGSLRALLEESHNPKATADCLVGVSGGKDSAYTLLQLKRQFGQRVEGFTYVHDAMSEFALENARRVCRALDIEHHVVSLPGRTHVNSFAAFFEAWTESRDRFTAATTCAACKHLHLLGTRLASRRGIPLVVWANCPLESPAVRGVRRGESSGTLFKGTKGMLPHVSRLLLRDRLFRRAFLRYAPTCVLGWLSVRPDLPYLRLRYPRVRHVRFFDYCTWHRERIISTLQQETSWSTPESVPNDWHSDCHLHVLKEYINQSMMGSSSVDAHLSNLVRHGLLTREQAWRELLKVKAYDAAEVPRVLASLGLERLLPRLDLSCFDIEHALTA